MKNNQNYFIYQPTNNTDNTEHDFLIYLIARTNLVLIFDRSNGYYSNLLRNVSFEPTFLSFKCIDIFSMFTIEENKLIIILK